MRISKTPGSEGFSPLTHEQLEEILTVSTESSSTKVEVEDGRALVPFEGLNRGAFFKVVIPKGVGPFHLARLIITGFLDGSLNEVFFVLVLYDVIERIFDEALRKREFRMKWRKELQALKYLSVSLNLLEKHGYIKSYLKYLIINRMGSYIDLTRYVIPPKNRNNEALERVQIVRHREYQPSPKKSTKVPSNSAGTKGTYQPNSISWKEVAAAEVYFHNGKWYTSRVRKNPTEIGEIT